MYTLFGILDVASTNLMESSFLILNLLDSNLGFSLNQIFVSHVEGYGSYFQHAGNFFLYPFHSKELLCLSQEFWQSHHLQSNNCLSFPF